MNLGFLDGQDRLIRELKKTGKPIILVLIHGRPMSIPWAKDNMDAILSAWFPSEYGGEAIADVLFGDYNPNAKLPCTFPEHVGQIPIYYGHKPSGGAERMWGAYTDDSHDPIYYFGYGLSYTKFKLSNFSVDKKEVQANEIITIKCNVENTGNREGAEVVQLYIRNNALGVTRPVKELKGFNKVFLSKGETKTVCFEMPINIIGFYDENIDFVVHGVDVDIMVGTSSVDIKFSQTLHIEKTYKVEDKVFSSKTYLL